MRPQGYQRDAGRSRLGFHLPASLAQAVKSRFRRDQGDAQLYSPHGLLEGWINARALLLEARSG